MIRIAKYSHLSNNRGGCNKRGVRAKVAKSINVEVGIKEVQILNILSWNKRGGWDFLEKTST